MRRLSTMVLTLAVVTSAVVTSASATTLCMQEGKANAKLTGPATAGGDTCKAGYEAIELPSANELEILKHATYESEGIDKKPTVRFTGVNIQIVDGAGATDTTTGAGNLVIGYDEVPQVQSGSHNLVLGQAQGYTSYGGIVGGYGSLLTAPYTAVTGGLYNTVTAEMASVSGGYKNTAGQYMAWVGGGSENFASGYYSSIVGGHANEASGLYSAILGQP